MTKSNKQKSLFKRILCGCLSILLLPYHLLYAWFLWTERQREEAESSSNHSSLYDNDIFQKKRQEKQVTIYMILMILQTIQIH